MKKINYVIVPIFIFCGIYATLDLTGILAYAKKAAKKSESKNVKIQNEIDEMKQEIQSLKKETKQNPIEKEETINGTYSNIEKIAGQNFKYTVKIYGDIWTSSLEPELFGEPEYERGIVKGKDLFDNSGFFKQGYVYNNTVQIGKFSATKN